jgi:membrane protease YdiL (CAAX protease family)
MGVLVGWLRRWFPILYGLGFALVLIVLVVKMHTLTNELWLVALHPLEQNALNINVPRVFWHSLAMVVAMAILGKLIERVDAKFRPVRLIASNLNFRPLLHPWMRYPFAALLLYNLPILAMLEEFIFRHGGLGPHPVQSWQDVLVSSLLFGLFHGVMSWNLRGGILQTAMGFWFSYVYLSSGASEPLVYASFHHFMLDLLVFTPGVIQLCFFSRHLTRSENPNPAL